MQIEDALNLLDEMIDCSWSLPLSGGRCVIDAEQARDIIDTIRITLPEEFQRAEALLEEREKIIADAQKEGEEIVRQAEERARVILDEHEAVKAAEQRASNIMSQTQTRSREIRMATTHFTDTILKQTEDSLAHSLEELRMTRKALNNKTVNTREKVK